MKQGTFYEIGAKGAVLRYLLADDWVRAGMKREKNDDEIYLDPEWEFTYNMWQGVFVEPLPENTQEVMDYLIQDGIKEKAKVVACAVGPRTEITRFETLNLAELTHLAETPEGKIVSLPETNLFDEYLTSVGTIYVPMYTLDDLFEQLKTYPDLLRIDIEGAEVAALENYSFDPRPHIIQVDSHKVNMQAVVKILTDHNYTVRDDQYGKFGDDVCATDNERKSC